MSRIIALFFAVLTLLGTKAKTNIPKPVKIEQNVSYGSKDYNKMDVYIPYSAYRNKQNGCILFIHGGSWTGGDKKSMRKYCQKMADEGYITATMNYMLFSESTNKSYHLNKVLDEVTAAVSKLKNISNQEKLNINKLAVGGFSAGGHIAMMYAYSKPKSSPIPIKFCISMSGPSYFGDENFSLGLFAAVMLQGKLFADSISDKEFEKCIIDSSPVTFIGKNTVPSIFAYGKNDKTVPYSNSTALTKAFDKYKLKYDFISFANSGHNLDNEKDSEKTKALYKAMTSYCKTYFG